LARVTRSRDEIQAALASYTTWPGVLQSELTKTTRFYKELQAEVARTTRARDDLAAEVARLRAGDDGQTPASKPDRPYEELRAELDRMLASKSWRFTKPLRAVGAVGRRAWRSVARRSR